MPTAIERARERQKNVRTPAAPDDSVVDETPLTVTSTSAIDRARERNSINEIPRMSDVLVPDSLTNAARELYTDTIGLTPGGSDTSPMDELFKGVPGGLQGALGAADAVLATATQAIPSVVGSVVGTVEGIGESIAEGTYGTKQGARTAQERMEQRAGQGAELGYQPRTEAGNKLMENLSQVSAKYAPPFISKGVAPLMTGVPKSITKQEESAERIRRGDESEDLAKVRVPNKRGFNQGKPLEKDYEAVATIKQGFEPKTVQMIKQSSDADKRRMLEMVDRRERGLTNLREEQTNRAHDVAGRELQKNINKVQIAKRKAGKDVAAAANDLKGKSIEDAVEIGDRFRIALEDELNIKFDPTTGLRDYSNSVLQLSPELQTILNKVIAKARGNISDAYELHTFKQALTELINYEKDGAGIGGRTEAVLKDLRADIDGYLDGVSGEYDIANQRFSALADAMNSIRTAAGKTDFDAAFADKQLGTLLRRLGGNAVSRSSLMDAIEKLQAVGGIANTDLMTLFLFAEKLDDVLASPAAISSFKGDLQRGAEAAMLNNDGRPVLMDMAKSATDRMRGINDQNALLAIRQLLERDISESAGEIPRLEYNPKE